MESAMNGKCCNLNTIVNVLMIVGALNWGLVGLLNVDLVALIFSSIPMLQKAVYVLVGLAGIMGLVELFKSCCKQ
jgi:uncharacterized protein